MSSDGIPSARVFSGLYYNGRDASAVEVQCESDGAALLLSGAQLQQRIELSHIAVTARLGRTQRILSLPDGAQIHTGDNDAVDAMFLRRNVLETLVDRLERHWRAAVASVLITITALALFFTVGLPWLADRVAQKIPLSVERVMGEQALSLLKRLALAESTLPAERRAALRARFDSFAHDIPGGEEYHVEFFHAGEMANAFALPGGTIVFTDEIVLMFANDDEFLAVAAHEIGHEQHRHLMRLILRDSAIVVIGALFAGDVASASTLVVAIPTFLLQNHYTRAFEADADEYAFSALAAHGISPQAFADVMRKLDAKYSKVKDSTPAYASTHPPTAERIQRAEEAARRFKER